jgi:hypothetical protein
MSKISRRDLLRAGAGTSAAAGLMVASGPLVARAGEEVHGVHVHAVFIDGEGPGSDLLLDEWAFGPTSDLNGAGWDHTTAPAGGVPPSFGACIYTRKGKYRVKKNRIELTGTVILANDPANLDAPVTTVVDTVTGEITWTFATFEFTGTAAVTIF